MFNTVKGFFNRVFRRKQNPSYTSPTSAPKQTVIKESAYRYSTEPFVNPLIEDIAEILTLNAVSACAPQVSPQFDTNGDGILDAHEELADQDNDGLAETAILLDNITGQVLETAPILPQMAPTVIIDRTPTWEPTVPSEPVYFGGHSEARVESHTSYEAPTSHHSTYEAPSHSSHESHSSYDSGSSSGGCDSGGSSDSGGGSCGGD